MSTTFRFTSLARLGGHSYAVNTARKLTSQNYVMIRAGTCVTISKRMAHGSLKPGNPARGGDTDRVFLPENYTKRPLGPQTVEDFANPTGDDKNWVSYGADYFDKENDRRQIHLMFFYSISLMLCLTGYVLYYYPDQYHLQNWAVREAFLELHRREKNGLPLVDKNYVDPAKIELPDEEELKGNDIYY